jgi:hypothetical protein
MNKIQKSHWFYNEDIMKKILTGLALLASMVSFAHLDILIEDMHTYSGEFRLVTSVVQDFEVITENDQHISRRVISTLNGVCEVQNEDSEGVHLKRKQSLRIEASSNDSSKKLQTENNLIISCYKSYKRFISGFYCNSQTSGSETTLGGFLRCLSNFERPIKRFRWSKLTLTDISKINKVLKSGGFKIIYKE